MDALNLDARTLLYAARAVGFALSADGDRLAAIGPKGAVGLVQLLSGQKADILAALKAELEGSRPDGPRLATLEIGAEARVPANDVAFTTSAPLAAKRDGPRDFRKGDRWLPWHGAEVRRHDGRAGGSHDDS
jgi:hypothetical protein